MRRFHESIPRSLSLSLLLAVVGCGTASSTGSSDDAAGGDAAGGETSEGGAGGEPVGGDAQGGGGDGGSPPEIELGDALVFRQTAPAVLVDTRAGSASCGVFAPIDGAERRIVIDLDDCGLDPSAADAVGVVGSFTLRTDSTASIDVRVGPSGAAVAGAPHTVGPIVSSTHGFVTLLGTDRAFVVEVPGTATADVVVELSAILVPEASGGDYMHLLDQPLRWYAANPNDDGFKDPWSRMDTVHQYSVLGAEEGATGMFGAVHLGPGVWRDERVAFHMGPAQANAPTKWSTAPVDAHFPWRYTSLFAVGAQDGQVELRASSDDVPPYDSGIEPWIDAIGWFSPSPTNGLVYRPLSQPLKASVKAVNEQSVRLTTGVAEAKGVVGTLVFELPPYNAEDSYRWCHIMVGATEDTFGGALGGGLEGPDWMTAGLNQNGKVTVRFVSKTDDEGAFVMHMHSYVSGIPVQADFDVPVEVHVEAMLTDP